MFYGSWKGAQLDFQDIDRRTALIWASRNGHADAVGLLLDGGRYTYT